MNSVNKFSKNVLSLFVLDTFLQVSRIKKIAILKQIIILNKNITIIKKSFIIYKITNYHLTILKQQLPYR
jgi:hypothetical protein